MNQYFKIAKDFGETRCCTRVLSYVFIVRSDDRMGAERDQGNVSNYREFSRREPVSRPPYLAPRDDRLALHRPAAPPARLSMVRAHTLRLPGAAARGRERPRGRERRAPPRAICRPLQSTDELLSWRLTASAARCISRVALPASAIARYALPSARGKSASSAKRIQPKRLLICHDFGGGYTLPEAASDGVSGDECPPDKQLWRFNHWAYVDIFVYFSHQRVTIPPVGYIHAAHRHGALALGTLIFEWEAGERDLRQLLASYSTRRKAATQLALIAYTFKFDGWLVNVECGLAAGASGASDLAAFVKDLTRACRSKLGAASEVIWYDSVTRKGELKYQNELNEENEVFFKAAGAMFTNYHWTRHAPVRSAVKAGPHRSDIFTGIDAHGRNTYGGGGFNTHTALNAIGQAGTSAAIFAPAWTVENCPPGTTDPMEIEERFWTGPRGRFGRGCVAQYIKERAVITQLPFVTFFDPGWGPKTVSCGKVVSEDRYFNMSRQDVQPSFLRAKPAAGDCSSATLSLSHEQALNGSASVRFTFSFAESRMLSGTYAVLRLFVANVRFPKAGHPKDAPGAPPEILRLTYQYFIDDNGSSSFRPSASNSRLRPLRERIADNDQLLEGGSVKDALDDPPPSEAEQSAATAARAVGANQFGLLLLFTDPLQAVLLVSADSNWLRSGEAGVQRASRRLEILNKFVNYTVIAPVSDIAVRGAPARADGTPSWMARTYNIPESLTKGQRLAEVMVLLGDPPLQPISVRPSPLVTPGGGGSRSMSQRGSRLNSRSGSPTRRQPSDSVSSLSLRLNRQPRTRLGAELLSAGVLGEGESNSALAPRRESFRSLYENGIGPPRRNTRAGSGLTDGSNDAGSDFGGSDASDGASYKSFNSRSTLLLDIRGRGGPANRSFSRQSSMPSGGAVTRAGRMDEIDYTSNFAVSGSVDFSHMEADMLSTSTSRAISRLGSRLQTPNGGRSSARLSLVRSRMASRQASMSSSRVGSRLMSPASQTPLGMRSRPGRRDSVLPRANTLLPRSDSMRPESMRGSAALADLKSALMSAAGTMASGGEPNDGNRVQGGGARRGPSRGGQRVYLGGLALEIVDADRRP